MSSRRKIASHYLLCPRLGLIPRAIVTLEADGTIVSVENDVSKIDSLMGVEFYNGLIIPGMVNAHCHLELSYLKGKIPANTGLFEFVSEISKIRNDTPEEEKISAADLADSRMRSEGIVAVGDICNDKLVFPEKYKSNINYYNFIELFGLDPSQTDDILSRGMRLARESMRYGMNCTISPHSTYSVSENLLSAVAELQSSSHPLSIHFMESEEEAELFRGKGRFAAHYKALGLAEGFSRFSSPAERLLRSFLPDTPVLSVHNTFVKEEDIDRLNEHFKELTWVICPRSNQYIEHSFPPVDLLRKKGCRIAIGTDSLSSNHSLSIIEGLKSLQQHTNIPLHELIVYATLNGAQALRMDGQIGTFEPGKKPGLVLLDHIDWNNFFLTPESKSRRIG